MELIAGQTNDRCSLLNQEICALYTFYLFKNNQISKYIALKLLEVDFSFSVVSTYKKSAILIHIYQRSDWNQVTDYIIILCFFFLNFWLSSGNLKIFNEHSEYSLIWHSSLFFYKYSWKSVEVRNIISTRTWIEFLKSVLYRVLILEIECVSYETRYYQKGNIFIVVDLNPTWAGLYIQLIRTPPVSSPLRKTERKNNRRFNNHLGHSRHCSGMNGLKAPTL